MSRENVIISLDGHTHAVLDLKPWMPKQYHSAFDMAADTGMQVARDGIKMFADMSANDSAIGFEAANDIHNLDKKRYFEELTAEERIARIDEDGVAAELIIDTMGPVTTDPVIQHQITQAFIRWFKDYVSPAPHRFTAAVSVSLAAGMDIVEREIEMAWEHGIRAINLATTPAACDPNLPRFNHYMYEPMWNALNERGMAAVWHTSQGREKPLWRWDNSQRGGEFLCMLDIQDSMQTPLKQLLLAGVPERYPNLKIGFIEGGSGWIPAVLKSLDRFFGIDTANPKHKLQMSPSEQFARQGFAAGPLDINETNNLDQFDYKNLCFGSDDIHTEGSWPNTRKHLAEVTAGLSEEQRWAVVAGNAERLLGFDVDKLAQTKAAQTPWRAEDRLAS